MKRKIKLIFRNEKKPKNIGRYILLGTLFLIISPSAFADALIPSIMLIMPIMGVLLIPIIVIEAFVFHRILCATWKLSFKVTTISNLFSTLLGIPIAWFLSFFSTFAIFPFVQSGEKGCMQSAWIPMPSGKDATTIWADNHHYLCNLSFSLGAIFMIFCFFLISWFSEYWVSRWIMRNMPTEKNKINRAVGLGNFSSYLFICIFLSITSVFVLHLY